MYTRPKALNSGLNSKMFISDESSILHLYANDSKMTLILEKLVDSKHCFYVKEVKIRHTPLSYQSDRLASDEVSTHGLETINGVLSGLEHRRSIALDPVKLKAVEEKIKIKYDPKDSQSDLLINPTRKEYLESLFSDCPGFSDSVEDLAFEASRKKHGGCLIQ